MVSSQHGPHGDFRRVTQKLGEVGLGPNAIELFHSTIQNPEAMRGFMPKNLVDFRTCPHVPEFMRAQGAPEDRWVLFSSLRGLEVAYSKEFINWKLWGISKETSLALRSGFADDDPCYLSDYGSLGLAAKRAADESKLENEDRFMFCREYILDRVESTPAPELGLFGAWLLGAQVDPQFVKQTAYEAIST